ncbi:MAG TPA: DUF1552 domain-containing protein [Pseudobdellovibrionaceae bacterium]|jgi:hypothetical protein
MSNFKISRRKFMSSTGMIFTIPLLESLFPLSAEAANDPRRYVIFYFPNGTYNRSDKPIWATRDGALSSSNTSLALSPFSANYGDMISINYLKNDANFGLAINDDHARNAAAYLTCASSLSSSMISFENVLADKFGKAALVLSGGVTSADLPPDSYISYRNGKGNMGISNPGDLYRNLLNQVIPNAGPTPTPTPTVNNGKSILDATIADLNSFMKTLGRSDKAKMEEFLTSVRALELKVASTAPTPVPAPMTGSGTGCVKPTLDSNLDSANSRDAALYLPKFYAMNDMIKIAFACDITRSISVMVDTETTTRTYAKPPSSLIYNGADISGGYTSHIAISHASGLSTSGYNLAVTRDRVLMQIPMDLVNKLKSANDPSGSRILDNTIIQAGFGVQDGNHSASNNQRPLILAGGRNMLNLGTSRNLSSYQLKDLYYTISNKIGAGLTNFQGSSTLISL